MPVVRDRGPWRPTLAVLSALAAAAGIATRLPFAARRLWDHDSVQFALGVERYDLAAHHPHPPGYPLYIAVLKVLAALGVSPLHGMVALSVLAAGLGAGLIVPLTARLVEEGRARGGTGGAAPVPDSGVPAMAGALAAALFLFNPILWFYGELPLVYAVEGGMTVGLAWAALRMSDGRGAFVAGCAAFALAGGIRPSTLVLLLPLFLFGAWRAWRRGLGAGTLALGAAVGTLAGLAWLVPLLMAAGGLAAYRRIGAEHFSALLPYTSILYGAGWKALAHNLTIMTKWFLQGLLPAAAGLALLWGAGVPGRRAPAAAAPVAGSGSVPAAGSASIPGAGSGSTPEGLGNPSPGEGPRPGGRQRLRPLAAGVRLLWRNAPFLAAWAVPPVLFFALFHITKAGYTLVYLPALLVAVSVLAAPALGPQAAGRGRGAAAIALAAAVGAALFLFGADRRPDQPRALAIVRHEFNRRAIATYERDLDRLLAILRRYPPATTVLATVELSGTGAGGPESFLYPWQRHLQWYLPEYEVLHLVPEERLAFVTRGHHPFRRVGAVLGLPAGTRQLALVLAGPPGERFPLGAARLEPVGDTFWLTVIPVPGRLQLGPFALLPGA